jgi:subtilisin family serine protease
MRIYSLMLLAFMSAHGGCARYPMKTESSDTGAEQDAGNAHRSDTQENDQRYSVKRQAAEPWHLDRVDQSSADLDGHYTPFGIGNGVVIYVLDTGIRYTHQEFGDRAAPFKGGSEGNYVNDAAGDTGGAMDCHGHGTHVAALAVGNTVGVAPGAEVRAVRVGDCTGRGDPENAVAAIEDFTAGGSLTKSDGGSFVVFG